MVEECAVAGAGVQRLAGGVEGAGGVGAGGPGVADGREVGGGEGVEEGAVAAGVEEAAVVLLAVQLDEGVGEGAQGLGGDAAVVGPGLAAAVGGGGAAEDQLVAGGEAGDLQHGAGRRGRGEARRRR